MVVDDGILDISPFSFHFISFERMSSKATLLFGVSLNHDGSGQFQLFIHSSKSTVSLNHGHFGHFRLDLRVI